MTDHEIIRLVDAGANHYLRLLGDAVHMNCRETDCYTAIEPKPGEQGVRFVFDVSLENLPKLLQAEKVAEIKALGMPVWWGRQLSDSLCELIYGECSGACTHDGDGEAYMAVLPLESAAFGNLTDGIMVKQVESADEFARWAEFVNLVMSSGYTIVHPVNHWHLCESSVMRCFMCLDGSNIASVAATMGQNGADSLEFVATDERYRRRGFARAVCSFAVRNAARYGAEIITLRADSPSAKALYISLGFKVYG